MKKLIKINNQLYHTSLRSAQAHLQSNFQEKQSCRERKSDRKIAAFYNNAGGGRGTLKGNGKSVHRAVGIDIV